MSREGSLVQVKKGAENEEEMKDCEVRKRNTERTGESEEPDVLLVPISTSILGGSRSKLFV